MNPSDLPKIDAHTHLFYDRNALVPLLDRWNLSAVVINITGRDFFEQPMDARWAAMCALKAAHPGRFTLCTTFDPRGIEQEGFARKTIQTLERHLREGAEIVKVWKDVGLDVREASGAYVQVDDPRFQPIWEFLAERGVPVIAHIAEPKAAWQPLDEGSPHYTFYRDHPKYHFHGRSGVPAWEEVIAARDRWLARNPDLTVIGAHLGSMAHDLDEVARRLDRFPNFYVDTAERFADLVIQPTGRVRDFFLRHADRILYGTDAIVARPAGALSEEEAAGEVASYEALLRSHWAYLASDDALQISDNKFLKPVETRALNLPREVIEKVYFENAIRLLDHPEDPL